MYKNRMRRSARISLAALCLACLLIIAPAAAALAEADVLALPASLTKIEERAFYGNAALQRVVVPEGVTSVGSEAFKGCAEDLLLICSPESAAMEYAIANRVDYRAGTTYRALLIGQTYPKWEAGSRLKGPTNDVKNMQNCIARFKGTNFKANTIVKKNLTAQGILNAISSTFAGAKRQDVSLFYYSGHGYGSPYYYTSLQGALVGTDDEPVTVSDLRAALDEIPGRKVVIIDACYSGSMITRGAKGAPSMTAEQFVDSFIAGFASGSGGAGGRAKGLTSDEYYVITAASDNEESMEFFFGTKYMGLFTACLVEGCGWDGTEDAPCERISDINENGVITLKEGYDYAEWLMDWIYSDPELEEYRHHAQVYPADCGWFGLLRTE